MMEILQVLMAVVTPALLKMAGTEITLELIQTLLAQVFEGMPIESRQKREMMGTTLIQ